MTKKPVKTSVDVWKCEDLRKAIRESIDAHVKDAGVAERLDKALSGFYAYRATSRLMLFDEPSTKK